MIQNLNALGFWLGELQRVGNYDQKPNTLGCWLGNINALRIVIQNPNELGLGCWLGKHQRVGKCNDRTIEMIAFVRRQRNVKAV